MAATRTFAEDFLDALMREATGLSSPLREKMRAALDEVAKEHEQGDLGNEELLERITSAVTDDEINDETTKWFRVGLIYAASADDLGLARRVLRDNAEAIDNPKTE
jgi:hypothetical protein